MRGNNTPCFGSDTPTYFLGQFPEVMRRFFVKEPIVTTQEPIQGSDGHVDFVRFKVERENGQELKFIYLPHEKSMRMVTNIEIGRELMMDLEAIGRHHDALRGTMRQADISALPVGLILDRGTCSPGDGNAVEFPFENWMVTARRASGISSVRFARDGRDWWHFRQCGETGSAWLVAVATELARRDGTGDEEAPVGWPQVWQQVRDTPTTFKLDGLMGRRMAILGLRDWERAAKQAARAA